MTKAQPITEVKLITGEELFRMPGLERCELVEKIVTTKFSEISPSPPGLKP